VHVVKKYVFVITSFVKGHMLSSCRIYRSM